jgi:hypothetical protein
MMDQVLIIFNQDKCWTSEIVSVLVSRDAPKGSAKIATA